MRFLTTLFFYFLLQSTSFSAPLKDFTASYDLYRSEMYIGQSTKHLTTKNNLLTFSSVAKTEGVAAWFYDIRITEESKLRYKDQRLSFFSYSYDENKNDKKKNYQLHLAKQDQFYNSHTQKLYPVTANLHDTLGFTLAIMYDMQAGKREMKYTIAEKDKLKNYSIKFIKKENLPTYDGEIRTLKMEHYNPQTKLRFTFWCAEDMGFLPIRIRKINYKGKEVLLNLSKFNQKDISLTLDDEEID